MKSSMARRVSRGTWLAAFVRTRVSSRIRRAWLPLLAALALGGRSPLPGDDPGPLTPLGTWPGYNRGPAYDVAVAGDHAYVAIGEGGLLIVDVSEPARPFRVGTYAVPGITTDIEIVGSRAYVATMVHRGAGCQSQGSRGQLLILDLANPREPRLLGQHTGANAIYSLHVDGTRAYLGDREDNGHECDLTILDVSHPDRLVELAVDYSLPNWVLHSAGDRLYCGSYGPLLVVDVRDPRAPKTVAMLEREGMAEVRGLQSAGGYLYAVERSMSETEPSRLSILELGEDPLPRLVGTLGFQALAQDLQLDGERAFVTLGNAGLAVIDIRDPVRPTLLGSLDTEGIARHVALRGTTAYVADFSGGLQIVDVADSRRPVSLARFDTGLTPRLVRWSGDRAYLLSSDAPDPYQSERDARSRLEILDLTRPERPALLGVQDWDFHVAGLEFDESLGFLVASEPDGAFLRILDLDDPARPSVLSDTPLTTGDWTGTFLLAAQAGRVFVVLRGDELRVFDIADPARPRAWTNDTDTSNSGALRVQGNHAFVLSDSGLTTVETSPNAAGPVGAVFGGGGRPTALFLAGGYAYAGQGWNGFWIADIRDPARPFFLGGYDTAGETLDVWVQDQYAYLAEGWEGLEIVQVSDPASPIPAIRWRTQGQCRSVAHRAGLVYLVDSASGLTVLGPPPRGITIVEHPVDATVALGRTGTFRVRAYASRPPEYQWFAGESGDRSRPIAGARSATFEASATPERAPYWVRVRSGADAVDSRTAWVVPAPPVLVERVGQWPGYRRGPALDVQVAGPLAYLALGAAGFRIFDLANPAAPRMLGSQDTPGLATGLALAEGRAYVVGDGLRVFDVTDPAAPRTLGALALEGTVESVVVAGTRAYLAGSQFWIIDVGDAAHPRVLGTNAAWGTAIAIDADRAYLAGHAYDARSGRDTGRFTVLDIRDPAHPGFLGSYALEGPFYGVAVRGDLVYVSVGFSYNPSNGTRTSGGLLGLDVTDPGRPRLASRFNVLEEPRGIHLSGARAYLPTSESGFVVLDLSRPLAPQRLGASPTNRTGLAMVTSGSTGFLAASGAGLHVFDLSNPSNPRLTGTVGTDGDAQDVAVVGSLAYLADGAGGMQILDVGDPTQPTQVGGLSFPASRLAAQGSLLLSAGNANRLLDLTDPLRPVVVREIEGYGSSTCLAGQHAYLGQSPGMDHTVLDMQTTAPFSVVGSHRLSNNWGTTGLGFVGSYLYAATGWEGLQVLDLAVPDRAMRVGVYYGDASVRDVVVRDRTACVTLESPLSGVDLLDLEDPARPVRIARISLPDVAVAARGVAFARGGYLCVTGDGLRVYDLGDPRRPVLVAHHAPSDFTGRLQTVGDLAYVTEGDLGLGIYRLAPQLRLDPAVREGNDQRLSWLGGPGVRLQETRTLPATRWQDVPGSEGVSSLRRPATNASAFYRLVRP